MADAVNKEVFTLQRLLYSFDVCCSQTVTEVRGFDFIATFKYYA